ncbi:MAG: radical SAM protein [Candidatus Hodarchaeota archaeon]
MVKYEAIQSSSKILNLYNNPDPWFWTSGSINPYRGCEHDCKYCDGKAEWYKITDFSTNIRIKINAPEKYEKELLKLGLKPKYRKSNLTKFFPDYPDNQENFKKKKRRKIPQLIIAVGGGVCDVYQPAEKKFKVTRQLLNKNLDFGIPTTILTKSKLVLRDLDLLTQIHDLSYANVSFSITLFEDRIRKVFEPNSASTSQRFKALKAIREVNLRGGVMFMPILPGIADTEENIKEIIYSSKEVGAEYVLPAGLTLKPGRNKKEYLDVIQLYYPEILPLYRELYGNNNKYGTPKISEKSINVTKLAHEICRKIGIPDRIPRYIPPGVYNINYLVSTILYNLAYYYQWVSEQSWHYVAPFSKTATIIESYPKDISSLSKTELLKQFNLTNDLLTIIFEILETRKSTELTQFLDPRDVFVTDKIN